MDYKLDNTGLCTGGRVQSVSVWCGFFLFFFLSSPVSDRADIILSPKECAVDEKLKGRQ